MLTRDRCHIWYPSPTISFVSNVHSVYTSFFHKNHNQFPAILEYS